MSAIATKPYLGRRKVRDRVVELVRMRAGDLTPNPRNWRSPPPRQRAAPRGPPRARAPGRSPRAPAPPPQAEEPTRGCVADRQALFPLRGGDKASRHQAAHGGRWGWGALDRPAVWRLLLRQDPPSPPD